MAVNYSRRQLAHYGVDQLLDGVAPSALSKHLAAALITSKKTKETDLLISDIVEELESRGLYARAIITSANELSVTLRKQLAEHIKKAAQVKNVSLNLEVDPRIIGGLKVETANHTWDKTIAYKLAEIKGGI